MRSMILTGVAALAIGLAGPALASSAHHRVPRHAVQQPSAQDDQGSPYSATAGGADFNQSDRVAPVTGPKMTDDGFLPAQNDSYLNRHSMGTMGSSGY